MFTPDISKMLLIVYVHVRLVLQEGKLRGWELNTNHYYA